MDIQTVLHRLGISELSTMQREVLDKASLDADSLLLAPTGTGKTLAYLLPLVNGLIAYESPNWPKAIVCLPSRELAVQAEETLRRMQTGLTSISLYGGRPAMEENRRIKEMKPDVVFATPGRLLDHLLKGNLVVDGIKTFVIDEFDKCLEIGFEDEMRQVIGQLPRSAGRWFLSATLPESVPQLMQIGHEHSKFSIYDYREQLASHDETVTTYLVNSPQKDKLETLARLLSHIGGVPTIVFLRYRESAERVGQYLKKCGFTAEIYHGGMDQKNRERALYRYRSGGCNVLVSTDLAARGLDIPETEAVVNYHLPLDETAFVHRTGRTGRWDKCGKSFIILSPEEALPDYVKASDSIDITNVEIKPTRPKWVTIYIGRGKKEKVSKGDVVGFLCKKGSLKPSEIGRIDIGDHYAYAAIVRAKAKSALSLIRGEKIKGQKTIFEEMK